MAYHHALASVLCEPQYESAPRGKKIREILNFSCQIKHNEVLFKNAKRSTPLKYAAAELAWYLSGDRSTKFIGVVAPFWKSIENRDGTVNSNYGHLAILQRPSQFAWALKSLKDDKDTRQAIIRYNNTSHQVEGNKDFTCTMYQIFHIRDNTLHMSVQMRSCDVIRGLTFDMIWFSFIHQQMYLLLTETYPNLVPAESFNFRADSFHIYEEHFDLASDMLKSGFEYSELPVSTVICNSGDKVYNKAFYDLIVIAGITNEPTSEFEEFVARNVLK